jgi:hypothetical protein
MITCDSSTGAIKVNTIKAPGIYNVEIIGTLPDLSTAEN